VGLPHPGRPFPSIVLEDMMALRCVEGRLHEVGCRAEVKIMQSGDAVDWWASWEGHIVLICRRTLTSEIATDLAGAGLPYLFSAESPPYLVHSRLATELRSPMDHEPAQARDYCVVARLNRPGRNTKVILIAGLHGLGTWAGGAFLTNEEHLQSLRIQVGENNFAALIECEFDQVYRLGKIRPLILPDILA
jgi:hypothetical protein